ncbi:MAG: ERCC4 domain-containing protein [Treponema sp.]|nr:ERCC4 domain-containing protein [Treponema sp.]
MGIVWIVQQTGNPRFPVRIAIEQDGKILFAVRAQDAWPGQRGNVFCIRDGSTAEDQDLFATVERVPVINFDRFGKSLRITLDRPTKKRCEFLILEKPYKNRPGSYEQIFFKTQAAQREHKSRSRLSLQPAAVPFSVIIDTAERYPWKFPKAQVDKRKLPAGDYALIHEDAILAVVERKTFSNLLSDFSRIAMLHQIFRDLESLPHPAVVVEADYGDFLNPERLEHSYKPGYCYRALAELQAMHPRLPIIFARTRKEANLWTYGFFRAVYQKYVQEAADRERELTAEPVAPYVADLRLEQRVLSLLKDALNNTAEGTAEIKGMSISTLLETLGDVDKAHLTRALTVLRNRGLAAATGRGKKRYWYLVIPQSANQGGNE